MRSRLPSALLAALACSVFAVSAQAQSPRTFVSAAGSDSNPCSFAAPCRHFQAAVNATAVGGEVDALDPAGYGPIIISHAITIEGQGWSYIAPPAQGDAIAINAGASDKVAIHGVLLNGAGINAHSGINFSAGASLDVQNCQIGNFPQEGVLFHPNGPGKLNVSNTVLAGNAGNGVQVEPSGTGTVNVVLDHVELDHNATAGLAAFGVFMTGASVIRVILSNSVSAHNGIGVSTVSQSVPTAAVVQSSIIAGNTTGLHADGTNTNASVIVVTRSTIAGNDNGVTVSNSGVVESPGDNVLTANGTDGQFNSGFVLQ